MTTVTIDKEITERLQHPSDDPVPGFREQSLQCTVQHSRQFFCEDQS